MHDRYELTLRRVLNGDSPAFTDEFLLADVRPSAERRFTDFSGDTSGRYIGALASATRVYGEEFQGLDGLVAKVIALQKPDGYFGSTFHYDRPTDEDLALLWGNGRLLVGLLEYYRIRPSTSVLTACKGIGDFLVRLGPLMLSERIRQEFGAQHFASSYICWTQQTEGLANLYEVTQDTRYRKLAEEIAEVIQRLPGDHVHGYLTSLRGVMDLYRATGDQRLLQQCIAAWQDIASSRDLLITGGVPEGWSPNKHRTEGCAEADWVRLNLALWKATGETKYLSMAERAIFNELAINQFATGDFGHRVYTETGLPAAGAVRAWWCCTLHGLRCFPDVQTSAFREKGDGLFFDLPIDGRVETASLSAVARSMLADNGTVEIRVTTAQNRPVRFRIRRPEWAANMTTRLNGATHNSAAEDGYQVIERTWAAGDTVEIDYGMELRSEPCQQNRFAYFYGPWLLGAGARDNFNYFNELTVDNRLTGSRTVAVPVQEHPDRAFLVPIAATAFHYAPAEYPDQPGTVVLRAIAEQTGQPTTSWELRLLDAEPVPESHSGI